MISDKTIEQLQEAVKAETIQIGNEQFVTRPIYRAPLLKEEKVSFLPLSTLSGFAEYVGAEMKSLPVGGLIIHIESHCQVALRSGIYGAYKQRDCYAVAQFETLFGKSFTFGQYYDHESFVVGLQSLFEPTLERETVLRVIGTIKESRVRETSDDGVSQAVSAKAGVALVAEVRVPNPVRLRPYRTFREVEQPESSFVLRVQSGEEKPMCALFEADGGRWKLEAIDSIAKYLRAAALELPIIS